MYSGDTPSWRTTCRSAKTLTGGVPAFTLVEMLVVIVILGILASLITVAATAALDKAYQTRIKVELDQLATAFQQYKNSYGSYPPNFVMDPVPSPDLLQLVRESIRRHMRKAFPRHRDEIALETLLGTHTLPSKHPNLSPPLTPAEAVVFWLGGFSADPEYPLTGPGGPLEFPSINRPIPPPNPLETSNLDDRTFSFDFDRTRLVRSARPFPRHMEFPTGPPLSVTVDLYEYHPPGQTEPFVYFDTSRFIPADLNNVALPSSPSPNWPGYSTAAGLLVRAYVREVTTPLLFEFVNPRSFQVLSAGTDDDWGALILTEQIGSDWIAFPVYPDGPYTEITLNGDVHDFLPHADNLTNFTTGTLEDAQP